MISQALTRLKVDEFVIYGNPTTEQELKECFYKVTGKDSYDNAILVKGYDQIGVSWEQIKTTLDEINAEEPMRLLRIQRDKLLTASDWRATIDYQGTKQSEWLTYRQALRDLPANTEDASNPTWPTPPESD